jgi:hypothetical protein
METELMNNGTIAEQLVKYGNVIPCHCNQCNPPTVKDITRWADEWADQLERECLLAEEQAQLKETKIMEALISLLIPALIMIESSGNDQAVGDGGKAIGCLQIWEPYWQDGTEYLGVDWPYEDAYDRDRAIKVTKAYLTRYGRHYERTQGKRVTLEVLARIHNGGPNGWNKSATDKYWDKVRKELDK